MNLNGTFDLSSLQNGSLLYLPEFHGCSAFMNFFLKNQDKGFNIWL